MSQQNSGPERQAPEQLSSTHQFEKAWEQFGQGGKVILTLCLIFLFYGVFLDDDQLIEIPEVPVLGDQHSSVVEFLENENIPYSYTEAGVLRVSQKNARQLVAFLDQFAIADEKPVVKKEGKKPAFSDSLAELTNFQRKGFQRSNNRIEKIVTATEIEVAKFEGVTAVTIVPNRLATELQSRDRIPRINRVSVQLELNEDKNSVGLDSGMVNLIKSHVSIALDVPKVAVQLSDTNGRFYEASNTGPTTADIRQKASVVEYKVAEFMANILDSDSYRIQVDVGSSSLSGDIGPDSFSAPWPSIQAINDKLIQLTPVTGPIPDNVVTLSTLKNVQSNSRWGSNEDVTLRNVAVTVFVDREPAMAVLDQSDPMQHLNFDPVIAIPSQDSFQSVTRDIAMHLEDHLRAAFRGDDVTARLVPVNLIGANGQLAGSSFNASEFNIGNTAISESSKNTTLFFFSIVAFLFVVLMFRDGPKDSEKGYSITGFHGGYVERSDSKSSIEGSFASGITPGGDPIVVQQIMQKTFEERVEILRAIVSNQEENLPGSDILALMIFDLADNRQEIFECLQNDECEVLFQLIDGINAPIGSEEIEDAYAAFELINRGLGFETDIPVLVTTVPTQPEIDEKVIADIRQQNPDLADAILRNRGRNNSGEVS